MINIINRRTALGAIGAGAVGVAGLTGWSYFNNAGALPSGQALQGLQPLANESNDPAVFKAKLAVNETIFTGFGAKTKMKLYNSTLPFQFIRAHAGTQFQFDITNNLAEDNTVHWHGLDIPPEVDGNPSDPIRPGESRSLKFTTPKDFYGSYWYHPHTHLLTAEQVAAGLAGVFIIDPIEDPLQNIPETTLFVIDFKKLDKNGQIPANNMMDIMNGRTGDYILCNGQYMPQLDLPNNAMHRFRIYNACSAEYLKLAMDHEVEMFLVGTDGGYIEKPVQISEILLAPAERAEIIIKLNGKPGRQFPIKLLPYNRGLMGGAKPRQFQPYLINIRLTDAKMDNVTLPTNLRTIPKLGAHGIVQKLSFNENMGAMQMGEMKMPETKMGGMDHSKMNMGGEQKSGGHNMAGMGDMAGMFRINNKSFDMNRIDYNSKLGQVELWEITNQTDMDHPLHIHGTQFQWVESERNGTITPAPYLCYKDTINVAPNEIVRFKLVQSFKGLRMVHCHILEHEENGMMATIMVG